jgi:hypothetical protein
MHAHRKSRVRDIVNPPHVRVKEKWKVWKKRSCILLFRDEGTQEKGNEREN